MNSSQPTAAAGSQQHAIVSVHAFCNMYDRYRWKERQCAYVDTDQPGFFDGLAQFCYSSANMHAEV